MKIKTQAQTTITFDAQEFADFVEQIRRACSVALGDLLALGMPSPATSTGKVLLTALRNIEVIQREMLDGMPEKSPENIPAEPAEPAASVTGTTGAPMRLVDFLTSLEADDSALAKALRIVSYRCDGNEDSEVAFERVWRRIAEKIR